MPLRFRFRLVREVLSHPAGEHRGGRGKRDLPSGVLAVGNPCRVVRPLGWSRRLVMGRRLAQPCPSQPANTAGQAATALNRMNRPTSPADRNADSFMRTMPASTDVAMNGGSPTTELRP